MEITNNLHPIKLFSLQNDSYLDLQPFGKANQSTVIVQASAENHI